MGILMMSIGEGQFTEAKHVQGIYSIGLKKGEVTSRAFVFGVGHAKMKSACKMSISVHTPVLGIFLKMEPQNRVMKKHQLFCGAQQV